MPDSAAAVATDRGVSAAGQVIASGSEAKRSTSGRAVLSIRNSFSSPPVHNTLRKNGKHCKRRGMRSWRTSNYPTCKSSSNPTGIDPDSSMVSGKEQLLLALRLRLSPLQVLLPRRPTSRFLPRTQPPSHRRRTLEQHGWDIDLMRDAAQRLLGEHDFRNLCRSTRPSRLPTTDAGLTG